MQRGTVREEIWRMLGRCTSKLQRLFSAICGLAALATIQALLGDFGGEAASRG